MEQYKDKLRITQKIYTAAALVLAAFSILFFLGEGGMINITPAVENSHWQSMWRGLVSGAGTGIAALILIGILRIGKALRDENALKKLYVADHDERQIQIWTSARATAMQIFLIFGLVAGIVAGYFNMTVSITILAVIFIQSLIGFACKLYFSKKF